MNKMNKEDIEKIKEHIDIIIELLPSVISEIKTNIETIKELEGKNKSFQKDVDDLGKDKKELKERVEELEGDAEDYENVIILKKAKGNVYDDLNTPLLQELILLPYPILKAAVEKVKEKYPEYRFV